MGSTLSCYPPCLWLWLRFVGGICFKFVYNHFKTWDNGTVTREDVLTEIFNPGSDKRETFMTKKAKHKFPLPCMWIAPSVIFTVRSLRIDDRRRVTPRWHPIFSYLFSKTRQWSLRRRSPSCEDTLHNVVGIMQKWIWLWYEWQLTDAIFFYTGFASLDVVHHGVWNNVFDADGWGNCMFQWGKKVIITKNVTMVLIRLNAPSNTLTLHCLKSLWKVVSVIMRFN